MLISDLFKEIYSALLVNKARSGLTILGIVIGIASVIAMVSIGQGAQGSIQDSIESLGSNLLLVMPGAQRAPGVQVSQGRGSSQTLNTADVSAITELALVEAVAPELSGRYQVVAKGTNTNTQVLGTTFDYMAVRNVAIEEGFFITSQNEKNTDKVVVLGPTARDDLFGEGASALGQQIRIKNVIFKVVGVTESKGGSGFSNQDDMLFVPLSAMQRYLTGGDYISTISVKAINQKSMAGLQSQITDLLLSRHKISDPTLADFSVMNQADIVQSASSVTKTFTMLLGSIAGISLVVGGIGIMNMMLTTVTERTREIGLRKAIGAKRKEINFQFLAEAVLLTFLGGIIGVLLGWIVSLLVAHFASLATKVSLFSIFLAFFVSAAIGIIFGFYPARRASKLNPIEALRYE